MAKHWTIHYDWKRTRRVSSLNAFGPARIWVSDERQRYHVRTTGIFCHRIVDTIHFELPTITDFNKIDDTETNHLDENLLKSKLMVEMSCNGSWYKRIWVTDYAEQGSKLLTNESCYTCCLFILPKPQGVRPGINWSYLQAVIKNTTTQFSFRTICMKKGHDHLPSCVDRDGIMWWCNNGRTGVSSR